MYARKFNLFLFPLCGVIYRSEAAVHLVAVLGVLLITNHKNNLDAGLHSRRHFSQILILISIY
jgi:hypothetical protein